MKHLRLLTLFSVAIFALVLVAASPVTRTGDVDDDDGEEIPFDEAIIFFELNNTDGDLGIHALIDGEPWKKLSIETPDGRENLKITLKNRMRRQGLTELFFESAEPRFNELSPSAFFKRFPEGIYEVEGTTIEGDEMESEVLVTHLMPAPAGNFSVNGELLPENCDVEPLPSVSEPFMVTWDAVTHSHPDLGRSGEPVEVVSYQLVIEREEPELEMSVVLSPDITALTLPGGLTSPGDEIKIEILTREVSGNQTAIESCFEVE